MKKTEQSFNSTLKRGSCELKRRRIKPVSDKRKAQNIEYFNLMAVLLRGCLTYGAKCAYRSELNSVLTDYTELHHIDGKQGARLLNPFNIIVLTPSQHRYETAHHTFERIQELKDIIRPIRIAQGFNPADYGEELPQ